MNKAHFTILWSEDWRGKALNVRKLKVAKQIIKDNQLTVEGKVFIYDDSEKVVAEYKQGPL